MRLSQLWSHAYVEHFLIYITPIMFSHWLKHWSSKRPLSKHLHLLLPCHFIGISESGSKAQLRGGKAGRNPGPELSSADCPSVSAAPCPREHPFLQFLPNIWEGWAGLPPPIPSALHKDMQTTTLVWLFLRGWSINHEEVHYRGLSSKLPRAKGAAGIRNQSNSETRTKGQVCSLPPDWYTSPAPGNQAPHPQAKQGQALQSRSGTWKGTTAAGEWWKQENKALNKFQAHNSPVWLPW